MQVLECRGLPLRGGLGNSDSVISGSLASPKPPAGSKPEERGDKENETQSRSHLYLQAHVALAAVKGDKTLAELAEQFRVYPTQITEWKQQLLAQAVDVFGGTKPTLDTPDLRVFPAKIGQLALENDLLEEALIKAGLLSAKR